MNGDLKRIVTADGSHSLWVKSLNETYHSRRGAFEEARHVFIREGLFHLLERDHSYAFAHDHQDIAEKAKKENRRTNTRCLEILEVGWGTGLNAILTLEQVQIYQVPVSYTALEPYPLSRPVIQGLNYYKFLSSGMGELFLRLHECSWEEKHHIMDELFFFTKHCLRLEDFLGKSQYDLVYFDAFALSKQPDIWSEENFAKLYQCIKPKGILVSYAANRSFKENLLSSGFEIHILAGPLRKREMIRAEKT